MAKAFGDPELHCFCSGYASDLQWLCIVYDTGSALTEMHESNPPEPLTDDAVPDRWKRGQVPFRRSY